MKSIGPKAPLSGNVPKNRHASAVDEYEPEAFPVIEVFLHYKRIIHSGSSLKAATIQDGVNAVKHSRAHYAKRKRKIPGDRAFLAPIIDAREWVRAFEELKKHFLYQPGFSDAVCKRARKGFLPGSLKNGGKSGGGEQNQFGGEQHSPLLPGIVTH